MATTTKNARKKNPSCIPMIYEGTISAFVFFAFIVIFPEELLFCSSTCLVMICSWQHFNNHKCIREDRSSHHNYSKIMLNYPLNNFNDAPLLKVVLHFYLIVKLTKVIRAIKPVRPFQEFQGIT